MSRPESITAGSRVVMHFSLMLEDGTEVVTTFSEEPLAFNLGDGTIEPALETRLIGLSAGDEQSLLLSGSEIYGAWESDNRQWIDRGEFPPSIELSVGQIIAFTTPAGDEVAGQVESLEEARVLLDFNHPLSGRNIIFKTTILKVETPE